MQFGSRPEKQCTSAVLHKLLCYNITRHTKETTACIENEAIGCFNCMVNNLLILCLHHLGMKPSTTQTLAQTWAQCTHFSRTQFEVSTQSYTNTTENLLFGPGQGFTIGPFLWLLCYCLMVDSMRKDILKYKAISCDNSHKVKPAGSSFVDDMGLGVTNLIKTSQPDSRLDSAEIKEAVTGLRMPSIGKDCYSLPERNKFPEEHMACYGMEVEKWTSKTGHKQGS